MVGRVIFIPGAGGDPEFWKPVPERVARDIELGLVFRCVPAMAIRAGMTLSPEARASRTNLLLLDEVHNGRRIRRDHHRWRRSG